MKGSVNIIILQNSATSKQKIDRIEETKDTLTSRGGLAFFSRYLKQIGLLGMLTERFAHIKGSAKGFLLSNMFTQLICAFVDGTRNSISHFNELKKDAGYAAAIETMFTEMVSRDQVERFFGKFNNPGFLRTFRDILLELFVWRLVLARPSIIFITIDTMVLDNDDAKTREGVTPTYKKVKGFQPFHMIWNGLIVDVIFRGGKKHGNHGSTVERSITRTVNRIREALGKDVEIVFLFDSAFCDRDIFETLDDLDVFYIAAGKQHKCAKEALADVEQEKFSTLSCYSVVWWWREFLYKCDSWKKGIRAFYTVPITEESGQFLLQFGEGERIILTNIQKNSRLERIELGISDGWRIIELDHSRGTSELAHRSIKEFASEKMPFKDFHANAAYYHLMVIAHFALKCFAADALENVVSGLSSKSYPNTIRRVFVDFAAKIVTTSRRIVLKTTHAIIDALNLHEVWRRAGEAMPVTA